MRNGGGAVTGLEYAFTGAAYARCNCCAELLGAVALADFADTATNPGCKMRELEEAGRYLAHSPQRVHLDRSFIRPRLVAVNGQAVAPPGLPSVVDSPINGWRNWTLAVEGDVLEFFGKAPPKKA
jgi:hypothetical protein